MDLEPQRTKCAVYTRVMGYYRPVSFFNTGKKSEFYNRKTFDYGVSSNSKFIKKYSNVSGDIPLICDTCN